MANNKHTKLATFSFLILLMLFTGVILAVVYLTRHRGQTDPLSVGLLSAAVALIVGGIVLTILCIILFRVADARDRKMGISSGAGKSAGAGSGSGSGSGQGSDSGQGQGQGSGSGQGQGGSGQGGFGAGVTYIPSQEAYDFIKTGEYQSLDEKFNEISKMDRTQFVIYIARLFSRKGYDVKFTPVTDNHDIDLLVEKMGVTIAVGCILSHKVLCKEDIVSVKNGRSYYGVNNSMALTNMYFDRTALDYAKSEHMSLVDRNILAQDFMV